MWWIDQVMTTGVDVPVGPVAVRVVVGLDDPEQLKDVFRLPAVLPVDTGDPPLLT